jgi:hypothetical protein
MFQKDFFKQEKKHEQSTISRRLGQIGGGCLHFSKLAFLGYSGYHGVSASLKYASNDPFAQGMQIVGILVIELTLFGLYVSWHNRKITGDWQSIAAVSTYALGFILTCLGIVADSQLHAGIELNWLLQNYLEVGLPIAPAFMALGALFTHELAPEQIRGRSIAVKTTELEEQQFNATIASLTAEMEAQKLVANMQLNARTLAAQHIATFLNSPEAQQIIEETARQELPGLLREVGMESTGRLLPATATENKTEPEPTPAVADPVTIIRPPAAAVPNGNGVVHKNGHGLGGDFLAD